MTVFDQQQLNVTIKPENATNQTVVWESGNDLVATVADGLVSAIGEGYCNITAHCGAATATCAVTVSV